MEFLLAIAVPLVVLGLAYLLISENQGLPLWLERLTNRSGYIWTFGIILIAVLSIVKFASNN